MCPADRSDPARTPDAPDSLSVAAARCTVAINELASTLAEARARSAGTEQRGGKFAPATSAITRSAPRVNEKDE